MEPERWRIVARLYQSALEVEESQRSAFLENACGEDESLKKEVGSLLARSERANNFLETSAISGSQELGDLR